MTYALPCWATRPRRRDLRSGRARCGIRYWEVDKLADNVTIPRAEYERMVYELSSSASRQGMELAELERRYQDRMADMQRNHDAEVTRLESRIHMLEQDLEAYRGAWTIACARVVSNEERNDPR